MSLNPKQERFQNAFRSGKFTYLCAAGTTGSGKSVITIGIIHLLCCSVPGVRFFIGRKSEKNLKQTTIPSYNEIKRKSMSMDQSVVVDMVAKYQNGSEIVFIWCDKTKDPDLNNIRGLEVNGGLFEEANQIDKSYFELAKTRIGRWRPELCKSFIMLNLNPSMGWVKEEFYDNWVDDKLPERYYFEQFDIQDAEELSGKDYVETLHTLAKPEWERFVNNKWNYSEIPNQLISYEWYKNCKRESDPIISPTEYASGSTDPAWEGDDDTVIARMHGNHIGWWQSYPKQDPDDTGDLSVQIAKTYNIPAKQWIVDPVGLGSATVLRMRKQYNYYPDLFYAGEESTDMHGTMPCFNKRSEALWLFREALREEEITFTHTPEFQKECLAPTYDIDEKKIRVISKKLIKKIIHKSPGMLDNAMMLIHKYKTENNDLMKELTERQIAITKPSFMTRAATDRLRAKRASRINE